MKKKLLALVLALTFVVPMSLTSPLAAAAMTLTITVEDSDVSYSVTVEDTMEYVYNLKCAIQEQTNFPAYLQTLYYGGSALDDFDMLASLGISDGKTLMLGKLYNITTEHAKAIVLDNYNLEWYTKSTVDKRPKI